MRHTILFAFVCLSAATFYAGALSAEVDVTSLLLEDNPLSGPLKTDPPDRWDRSR